ncbi:3-oxoacyl-[acyl-carrier-protein] reductase FabG [Variovorax sp. PBL-H6]|uniref:SDR family NAD(P)-dependent oxidoreductase n=1 Tax=Variovorax sp. PBL-H6 TaxID=434009 RepID=UPI0013194E57|nr:SDR family NAD(P)-dependent oxidoreductase [Variovorax sp. PBL-H6]VTU27221.1 3-oxoacyl-[acyl-carrier-protein] reductase FabG [Variovorax sp. PBL-H6]
MSSQQPSRRVALLTGGTGGLAQATAERFAADGMTVVIADLDAVGARTAAESLPGTGHRGIGMNVSDETSVRSAFDQVEGEIGPVAVLGCFAGLLSTASVPGRVLLTDLSLDEWEGVNAVNARGTFLCIREMARRRAAVPVEHGRIITIASLAGQQGGLAAGAAYSASKGAVLALTKVCARELASQAITVNAIAPGPIDTQMLRSTVPAARAGEKYEHVQGIPLGRVGLPGEIAAAVAWLASIDAGYITGATIDVNGGLYMR